MLPVSQNIDVIYNSRIAVGDQYIRNEVLRLIYKSTAGEQYHQISQTLQ